MTQKEIDKFLANTKVYVAGKSKEIQEKLFSLGYCWNGGCTEIHRTEKPFIYIYKCENITFGDDMEDFTEHKNREITAEEILSIELTEPDYRPFKDKDECWNEMLKHEPFGWVKNKTKDCYMSLTRVSKDNNFDYTFYEYVFADGTPFGIKEE